MRHKKKNRTFGRKKNIRIGFMRSLAVAFLRKEKIITTEARAKELRPYVEKMIHSALKEGKIHTKRILRSRLGNQETLANKLVDDIAPRYKDRSGGYIRVMKLPKRSGDASPMAIIELV